MCGGSPRPKSTSVYSPTLITLDNGLRAGRPLYLRTGPRSIRFLLLLAMSIFLYASVGCGGPKHDLVGKWRTSGDSALTWEFSPGGSLQMGSTRGKYSFGDQDRIKIETSSGISVYQIEISGEHMTLKDPSGSKLEFNKVR